MTTTMREVPHVDSVLSDAAASNPTGTHGSDCRMTRHELARVA